MKGVHICLRVCLCLHWSGSARLDVRLRPSLFPPVDFLPPSCGFSSSLVFPKALRYQRLINSRSDGGRRRNANLCICLFLTLQGTKCTMLIIYPILTLTESKPTSGWLTLWAVAVELLSVHRCDWMPPLLCTHWSLRIIPELIALLFCSSTDEQFRWNAQGKRTHAHT